MADSYNDRSPGVGNPLLPNNADNNNQMNRSGSTREAISDAGSRTADALTGADDDMHLRSVNQGAYGNSATMMNNTDSSMMNSSDSRFYSPMGGRHHLSGLFDTRAEAEQAVTSLERLGVPRSDISVIMRNEDESRDLASTTGTEVVGSHAGSGAGTGSIWGGTIGAVLGALAATATAIAIPGAGIIIAGPIAGALAGAGAGGLTGGLLGALVGAGVPEERAREYESGLTRGGVVVVADVPANLEASARAILSHAH